MSQYPVHLFHPLSCHYTLLIDFFFSSLNERQEWVDALQKAITDYTSRQLSFQNMKIASCSKNEDSSEPFKLGQEVSTFSK